MNRKNWVSALLAVMMVLSMAAMIILPSGAEATLTDEEIAALPLASKATKSDAYTAYKIDSVGELLAASHNSITSNANSNDDSNFKSGDVVYLTADLDIADWDTTDWATYDEKTGKYTTIGNIVVSTGNYRKYDSAATGVVCDTKAEVFAALFTSFNARNARYTYIYFDFNGLGHTIKNYYAYAPFFGGCFYGGATVSNVVFDGALVETAKQNPNLWTGTYAGLVGGAADIDGGVTFNNVHVNNSKLLTQAATNVGLFLAYHNNANTAQNRNCFIYNCSVSNSVVESTADSTAAIGLLVGASDQYVIVKNTLVMDSTVKVKAVDASLGGGFILSNRYGNTVTSDISDVAVINCQLQTTETAEPDFSIGLNYNAKTKGMTQINGLYATGNTWTTIDGEGNLVGESKPLTRLVIDGTNNIGGNAEGFVWGDRFLVDSTVEYLFYAAAPTAGFTRPSVVPTAEQIIEPMDANAAMNLLNSQTGDGYFMWAWTQDMGLITTDNPNAGPKLVTFKFADETEVTYITDYENKLISSPTERLQLKNREWDAAVGKNIAPGMDWGEKTFLEDASFAEIPHEVSYVVNEDGTHTATCNTCDEEIHNQTIACAEVVPESFFVEGNFYYPSVWIYECLCGHSWEEIDEEATERIEAPITVELDRNSYSPADEEIVVLLKVKDGASLSAFTAELTYDPAKMTLAGYEPTVPDYACVINDEDAANGKLIVAVPSTNGTILAGDVAALTFTYTTGVTLEAPEAAILVEANMIGAIVTNEEEGTVNKINDVVDKYAFDEAMEIFVEINVVPGDVDANGIAELLDAVLITEKRNGNIHADQDGYNFQIMAADVNNDGVVNDTDVELIMRAQNGVEEIELINCDAIPEVA